MKIFDFPFPIEIGSVCDLDFMPNGSHLTIQGSTSRQVLMKDDHVIPLPPEWSCPDFPFARMLSDGRILIVDTGFEVSRGKNAWILNLDGGVDSYFEIGAAPVEIVALWGLIAVAFHPISAKAHGYQVQPIQRNGIAFFDLQGRLISGFNQETAHVGVTIENVRCMTALSRSQLLFAPETATIDGKSVENPIVLYDCAIRRPKIFSAPFPRPEAVAMEEGLIHIASPEGWEDQIITFDPGGKISQHRGEFLGVYRGLEGGGFLTQTSAADYSVIVPEAFDSVQPTAVEALQH